MQAGVIRFKFVDNASERKEDIYDLVTHKHKFYPSPLELQTRFLANLHKEGYEPFDIDADGYQYWRRPQPSSPAE